MFILQLDSLIFGVFTDQHGLQINSPSRLHFSFDPTIMNNPLHCKYRLHNHIFLPCYHGRSLSDVNILNSIEIKELSASLKTVSHNSSKNTMHVWVSRGCKFALYSNLITANIDHRCFVGLWRLSLPSTKSGTFRECLVDEKFRIFTLSNKDASYFCRLLTICNFKANPHLFLKFIVRRNYQLVLSNTLKVELGVKNRLDDMLRKIFYTAIIIEKCLIFCIRSGNHDVGILILIRNEVRTYYQFGCHDEVHSILDVLISNLFAQFLNLTMPIQYVLKTMRVLPQGLQTILDDHLGYKICYPKTHY